MFAFYETYKKKLCKSDEVEFIGIKQSDSSLPIFGSNNFEFHPMHET